MKVRLTGLVALALLLGACGTDSPVPERTAAPKSELRFVDLQGFDQELSGALSAPLPKVDVAFYDRITPSAMPAAITSAPAQVVQAYDSPSITVPANSATAAPIYPIWLK